MKPNLTLLLGTLIVLPLTLAAKAESLASFGTCVKVAHSNPHTGTRDIEMQACLDKYKGMISLEECDKAAWKFNASNHKEDTVNYCALTYARTFESCIDEAHSNPNTTKRDKGMDGCFAKFKTKINLAQCDDAAWKYNSSNNKEKAIKACALDYAPDFLQCADQARSNSNTFERDEGIDACFEKFKSKITFSLCHAGANKYNETARREKGAAKCNDRFPNQSASHDGDGGSAGQEAGSSNNAR